MCTTDTTPHKVKSTLIVPFGDASWIDGHYFTVNFRFGGTAAPSMLIFPVYPHYEFVDDAIGDGRVAGIGCWQGMWAIDHLYGNALSIIGWFER